MPRGDWRNVLKDRGGLVVAAFFAALLILCVAWPAWLEHIHINQRAAHSAAHYAKDAQDQIAQKCLGESFADCARQINDAARSNQRYEYDLAAQETVAVWTAVMGWVGAVGVSLSLLGVFLVWTTFRETRRSADAAHDANRPWIEIDVMAPRLVVDATGVGAWGGCRLSNRGHAPATDVLIYAVLVVMPLGYDDVANVTEKVRKVLDKWKNASSDLGICVFPASPQTRPFHAVVTPQELTVARKRQHESDVFYSLGVGVRYKFGAREGQSIVVHDLSIHAPKLDYDHLPAQKPADEITLRQSFGGFAT